MPLIDGSYPAPPLNGTAHTWHHSLRSLKNTIINGGAQFGGSMPAFKKKLSNDEIEQVLAYIQNTWQPIVYDAWIDRGGLK